MLKKLYKYHRKSFHCNENKLRAERNAPPETSYVLINRANFS